MHSKDMSKNLLNDRIKQKNSLPQSRHEQQEGVSILRHVTKNIFLFIPSWYHKFIDRFINVSYRNGICVYFV